MLFTVLSISNTKQFIVLINAIMTDKRTSKHDSLLIIKGKKKPRKTREFMPQWLTSAHQGIIH